MKESGKMNLIKNLSLRKKILVGIGATFLVIFLIIMGIITYQFNQLDSNTTQVLRELFIGKERDRIKQTTHTAAQNLGQVYERNQADLSEEELAQLIREQNRQLEFGKAGYFFIYNYEGNTISLPPDQEVVGTNRWDLQDAEGKYIIRELAKAAEGGGGFITYLYENPNTGKEETKFGYVEPIPGTDWFIGSGAYNSIINSELAEIGSRLDSFRQQILIVILGSFVFGGILLSFVIYKLSDYIKVNVQRVVEEMKKVAAGKLDIELSIDTEDELGQLADQVNKTVNQQKEMMLDISDTAEDLSAYSEELSASAEEGNATIETTSGLLESMSANIQQISASAEEVTSFAQEASSQTEVGSQNIEKTLTSMHKISESVSKAVTVINGLDDTSKEIGKIVGMINDIAEQTNLLALNASIEAARAGEAGESFAVVADEIRGLAEETNEATEEIAELISETQTKTSTGLEAIKEVKERVGTGEEVVEETGEVFTEIEESSEETAAQIEETANATQDLAETSEDVRESSEDIQHMSDEVTNSSQELASMAQKLQALVEKFEL